MPNGDDRRRLIGFLSLVQRLLGEVCQSGRFDEGEELFPDEFRQLIRDAWMEIEQEETFPELERQISTAEENELRDVGLLGSQLSLKLGIFDNAWEEFRRI